MCSSLNYLFLKEEMDPYDNSPEPLAVLSAKKIIKDQISIEGLRLPREVGHLLSIQFRHHMLNRVTLTIETEFCEEFYRQFKPEYISLSYVDFSKLPITDKFLVEFVKRYRTTLTHLNISSCNKLTPVCFIKLNETLSEQHVSRRVRGRCTPTRELTQTRKKARALRNYESSIAATNARYYSNRQPQRHSSSYSSSSSSSSSTSSPYHNYSNKPHHQPQTPYARPRLPQTIYEHVYAGNGLVIKVPVKSSSPYYQGARPMRYITDFGRPNNGRDLDLDYDRYDFEDDHDYDDDDAADDGNDYDDDDECDAYANKDDDDDADDEDEKGEEGGTKIARVSNYVANKAPNNLKTLIVGETISRILPCHPDPIESALSSHLALKKLVAHKIIDEDFICGGVINHLITPTMHNTLGYLDLSNSIIKEGSSLTNLTSLRTLILYNCDMTYPQIITNICQLKSLNVLDISQVKQTESNKENFKGALKRIVTDLPELDSLDISGTQLVSRKDPEISGLKVRENNPFEFLGLFHTEEDASYRTQIPAISIAGDANESQILTACEAYIKRPEQLTKALNDLFVIFRIKHEFAEIITRALHIVLVALHEHLDDEHVQRAGTASLCCLSRTHEVIHNFNLKITKLIVSRVLDAMHRHKHCQQILQNGSLIFFHLVVTFKTQAWMDECYRLAAISLHMINTNFNDEGSIQRYGVAVLNSLACRVGGEQKIIMAELNAIVHMVRLIRQKLAENRCDDVLEAAWSTMWNITDESPINCQKFLGEQGLVAFEQCMDKFPENADLIRNIMGLLGNVAECGELRHHFMEERYMVRFTKLLSSTDMIECSYNACGILAHLMSDGQEFWDRYLRHRSRQRVLELMRLAISSWRVCQARSINYRSFLPIIKLLKPSLPPEVQYWAVWALTNLTRVYPNKYCYRFYFDGGHECLELLIKSNTAPYVKKLAMVTLYQCEWFDSSTDGTLGGLETSDSIDMDFIRKFRFREKVISPGQVQQFIRRHFDQLQEEEQHYEEDLDE